MEWGGYLGVIGFAAFASREQVCAIRSLPRGRQNNSVRQVIVCRSLRLLRDKNRIQKDRASCGVET